MNREVFIRLHEERAAAYNEYHEYVEQFFTKVWNNQITQEAKRGITPGDMAQIEELRTRVETIDDQIRTLFKQPD